MPRIPSVFCGYMHQKAPLQRIRTKQGVCRTNMMLFSPTSLFRHPQGAH